MTQYPIPASENRSEITVLKSRFIATISPAFSVEEARKFISRIKSEFPDATHHVPAYIIGYGLSTLNHCNDDGEPSGTAGRPALSVLRGSGLGDVAVVIARYYGGKKLGTGGLVRAYSDAVRQALANLPRAHRVQMCNIMVATSYPWFERFQTTLQIHDGRITSQYYASDITIKAQLPVERYDAFQDALMEMSHGELRITVMNIEEAILQIHSKEGKK